MVIERYALVAPVGYLTGSVPFGLYAARYGRLTGSASSNNLAPLDLYQRPGPGRKIAAVTFVLELFKGVLPTFTGYLALGTPGAVSAGSAALVGHNYSAVRPLAGVEVAGATAWGFA